MSYPWLLVNVDPAADRLSSFKSGWHCQWMTICCHIGIQIWFKASLSPELLRVSEDSLADVVVKFDLVSFANLHTVAPLLFNDRQELMEYMAMERLHDISMVWKLIARFILFVYLIRFRPWDACCFRIWRCPSTSTGKAPEHVLVARLVVLDIYFYLNIWDIILVSYWYHIGWLPNIFHRGCNHQLVLTMVASRQ